MSDINNFLMGGGVGGFKFDAIGATVKGEIVSADLQQQRDIKTGEPLTWDSGEPRMQVKIVIATDARDSDEDNGHRAIYVKGQMQQAVREAVRSAGATALEVGGTLAVRYDGDGEPTKRGFNAPKLYKAKYEAPVAKPAAVNVADLF
jgi:hypothetical protein